MNKHLRYAQYVYRHKLYVLQACIEQSHIARQGFALIWRGITHDMSKLRPGEWFPYAESFYGPYSYKDRPASLVAAFERAWLAHQHRNPHHYQHWVLRNDDGTVRVLPMSDLNIVEMLCDWRGAGKAIALGRGRPDPGWLGVSIWWQTTREQKVDAMHPRTVSMIDAYIASILYRENQL